jgi:cellulose synthase/poly-beta-1,6-N-acetylglucosamine synthase-like glycosyltransferase
VLSFILYSFYLYFENIELFILKTGAAVILFFTGLVIMRYMLLLFFSMLKILIKSSDENYSSFESKDLRVTLIVPAYNEEVVIEKSIRSLLEQTYSNLEILVVDDGSKDKTYPLAKKYGVGIGTVTVRITSYDKAVLTHLSQSKGLSPANVIRMYIRNTGRRLERHGVLQRNQKGGGWTLAETLRKQREEKL